MNDNLIKVLKELKELKNEIENAIQNRCTIGKLMSTTQMERS